MRQQRSFLALILVLAIAAGFTLAQFPLRLGLDLRGGAQLTIQVKPSEEVPEVDERVLEAVESVIRNRVDGLGVTEPVVQQVPERQQILVQLPGVNDPEQAEAVLGGTAQLDFRKLKPEFTQIFLTLAAQREQLRVARDQLREEVAEEATPASASAREPNAARSDASAIASLKEIEQQLDRFNQEIDTAFERTKLTGKNLEDAFAQPAQRGEGWDVTLSFDEQGGELFAQLTKELAGTSRPIGIFLDNELISYPTVGAEFAETGIQGGNAVITGNFAIEEANNLAVQLRGGALPVPVEVVENRTVGATLGRDSIQSSIYAGVGGLVLVLIFMVVYYRLPGAIADIALAIYSLLTLAAFALLGVTLTLPGIAGFILSIGMAVDANVLIFERTREELRAGKSLYRSVESGFYRAFSSILDSNVTTLIACAALFWFGTGFVRGFALTLAIGVGISMFTALTCSRTLLFFVLEFPTMRRSHYFCPGLPPR